MRFLIDTNVFLEILLEQDKKEICKTFLNENILNLNLTDFSLHSIGVVLFRYDKKDIFQNFIEDILPDIKLLSLPINQYQEVIITSKSMALDFDDAYQYSVAKHHGLKVVTMDKDFQKVEKDKILFL